LYASRVTFKSWSFRAEKLVWFSWKVTFKAVDILGYLSLRGASALYSPAMITQTDWDVNVPRKVYVDDGLAIGIDHRIA